VAEVDRQLTWAGRFSPLGPQGITDRFLLGGKLHPEATKMARVEIDVDGYLLDDLSAAFFWEEYSEPPSGPDGLRPRAFIVARVNGLSIKILADEHPSPHFHVNYHGDDASFSISDCARLPGVVGLERYDGKIRNWRSQNRNRLIEKWNISRPTDCPVGRIEVPQSN
jgi:hypothetical protein